jgi:hypothetical protein
LAKSRIETEVDEPGRKILHADDYASTPLLQMGIINMSLIPVSLSLVLFADRMYSFEAILPIFEPLLPQFELQEPSPERFDRCAV